MSRKFEIGENVKLAGLSALCNEGTILDIKRFSIIKLYAVEYTRREYCSDRYIEVVEWLPAWHLVKVPEGYVRFAEWKVNSVK